MGWGQWGMGADWPIEKGGTRIQHRLDPNPSPIRLVSIQAARICAVNLGGIDTSSPT